MGVWKSTSKRPHRYRISRGMAFIAGGFIVAVVLPFNFLVLPWPLSLLTPHLGWSEHGPAACNMLGLFPVVAGALGLVGVLSVMFAQIPKLPRCWSSTRGRDCSRPRQEC